MLSSNLRSHRISRGLYPYSLAGDITVAAPVIFTFDRQYETRYPLILTNEARPAIEPCSLPAVAARLGNGLCPVREARRRTLANPQQVADRFRVACQHIHRDEAP
jgi:hypothetical protein